MKYFSPMKSSLAVAGVLVFCSEQAVALSSYNTNNSMQLIKNMYSPDMDLKVMEQRLQHLHESKCDAEYRPIEQLFVDGKKMLDIKTDQLKKTTSAVRPESLMTYAKKVLSDMQQTFDRHIKIFPSNKRPDKLEFFRQWTDLFWIHVKKLEQKLVEIPGSVKRKDYLTIKEHQIVTDAEFAIDALIAQTQRSANEQIKSDLQLSYAKYIQKMEDLYRTIPSLECQHVICWNLSRFRTAGLSLDMFFMDETSKNQLKKLDAATNAVIAIRTIAKSQSSDQTQFDNASIAAGVMQPWNEVQDIDKLAKDTKQLGANALFVASVERKMEYLRKEVRKVNNAPFKTSSNVAQAQTTTPPTTAELNKLKVYDQNINSKIASIRSRTFSQQDIQAFVMALENETKNMTASDAYRNACTQKLAKFRQDKDQAIAFLQAQINSAKSKTTPPTTILRTGNAHQYYPTVNNQLPYGPTGKVGQ